MSEIDPYALSYHEQSSLESEVDQLQAMVDARDDTPRTDPMEETLRLAKLTGGANATLGLEMLTPESAVHLKRLEIARQAAYIAGLPKNPKK